MRQKNSDISHKSKIATKVKIEIYSLRNKLDAVKEIVKEKIDFLLVS